MNSNGVIDSPSVVPAEPGNRTTKPTSISLEIPLIEAGQARARKNRQSFSGYVASLIERDIQALAAEAEKEVAGA